MRYVLEEKLQLTILTRVRKLASMEFEADSYRALGRAMLKAGENAQSLAGAWKSHYGNSCEQDDAIAACADAFDAWIGALIEWGTAVAHRANGPVRFDLEGGAQGVVWETGKEHGHGRR